MGKWGKRNSREREDHLDPREESLGLLSLVRKTSLSLIKGDFFYQKTCLNKIEEGKKRK